jgi:uncharacterized glyoxalase superfamily protein PhnB
MSRPRVAPYLTVSPAAGAIAFYVSVFGATQRALMPALDGLRMDQFEPVPPAFARGQVSF